MSSFYVQDGEEATKIASVIPYYKFHGIDRFYDISGMLHNPYVFQLCIDIFVNRYKELDVDYIAGLDARGFVLGPPIALALKKPFVMIRKKGKLPNAIAGKEYFKEYEGVLSGGGDELCMPKTAISGPGKRVLIIDDLVATGGTLIAACDLMKTAGAEVVECACIVELKALGGYGKLQAKHPGTKVWGLISENICKQICKQLYPTPFYYHFLTILLFFSDAEWRGIDVVVMTTAGVRLDRCICNLNYRNINVLSCVKVFVAR